MQHLTGAGIPFAIYVSVSTSGSKGVQLLACSSSATTTISFSIHKRIEGGATLQIRAISAIFSVFQYPQADRRGCNCIRSHCLLPDMGRFQYPQADRRGCNWDTDDKTYCVIIVSFSIHKRIEGGATSGFKNVDDPLPVFQYPQADRRGCNDEKIPAKESFIAFQYPQADRRGCNYSPNCPSYHAPVKFQYPQADRRGCNKVLQVVLAPGLAGFSIHKRIEGGAT